ncbi:MAG: hypothetical protein LLG24_00120 [Actinomycetia bacterium]|nr:hypothetical protein [Actinomycetes bacterium]
MPSSHGWLNVIYRLPSKPSTLRVSVWKQVKELGGLPLQQSTYAFPDRPDVREGLAQIGKLVEQGGGEAVLLEVPSVDAKTEAAFVSGLARLRDEEYEEIIDDCEEMTHRIERKTERQHFDREELLDARSDVARVRTHFEAILARDYFGSPRREGATEAVRACEERLAAFARHVRPDHGDLRASKSDKSGAATRHGRAHVRAEGAANDVIDGARRALEELEAGTLQVADTRVEPPQDAAAVDLDYSERAGKHSLRIDIRW